MGPEVTVVIPTRNRWATFSTSALPSALRQAAIELEVIVVDEGSTDETPDRLAQVSDPRVRVIRHESPRGVAQARNAGIAAALGRWVAFLDDDDLWSPNKLRAQLDAAAAANVSWVYAAAAWLDERRRFLHALAPPPSSGLASRLLRWNELWAGGSNVVARTDVVRRLGGFDERLFQLADWDMWIRLALDGDAVAVNEILVGYVMQPQSMLLTDRRDVFAEFRYLVDKHAGAPVAPDAAKFARWVATGHLRAGRRRTAAATYLRGRSPQGAVRALVALLGWRGLLVARRLARAVRGDDPAIVAAAEPEWIAGYRNGE